MSCNCTNAEENNTIKFLRETTVRLVFSFDIDLSGFNSADFTIRKNYDTSPIIEKTITSLSGKSINVVLSPEETALFNDFMNERNSSKYIWGLNVTNGNGEIINVFPQTGNPAPLCIVYKNVVEEQ